MAPFEDLRRVLSQLPEGDSCATKKILVRDKGVEAGGGDELLPLKHWLATWQGTENPVVDEAHICVLAACYAGHEAAGVQNFIAAASKGRAPVNRLCIDRGVGLRVLELAPDLPYDPAKPWEQAECMAAVAFGMEATAAGGHLLGLSECAPGNIIPALSIILSLSNRGLQDIQGELVAKGIVEDSLFSMVQARVEASGIDGSDPLELLRLYGGREIAASVGAIVAARSRRLPVVIDGWSALAAVAILEAEKKGSTEHVRVASYPDRLAAAVSDTVVGMPLIGFPVAAGPGCGNAISVSVLKAACDL